MSKQVVIIGAGPAGLTGAYELNKLGLRSTVLEADDVVGGISRTVNYRGYRFDIGGHRFFSKVPLINELWREILGEDFLDRPRMSRIFYNGKFFDYPLKAANALKNLGPIESMLVGLSYARAKVFPSRDEENFEQWVSNRFGHRLYSIFFKTYTEKVWGIPCTEISADWAAQRIKNLSLTEAVRNALFGSGKSRDGQVITTLIDSFHYPRFGPGQMWERCEKLVNESGNQCVRGVQADRIRHRNGRVEYVVGRSTNGEQIEFAGDHFISSMPIRELIHAFDPPPPDEVLRAADGLRYRDYLTVVLIVNREQMFPDNWIYIHSPEVMMGRIQNYKSWSPDMVPDPRKSSLGLEYFLWDKDDQWTWSDDRLIELGIQECERIKIIGRSEVEDGTVVRMRKAYPIYDQHYQENLAVVRRWLDTIVNIQCVGRNGQHRYNNQDHSMLTAVFAARNIVGERHDVWSVNVEKEYHEEAKVATPAAGERLVPARIIRPEPAAPVPSPDELIEAAFARLDPIALGTAVGTLTGLGLFMATAILLLQHGPRVGENLSLLSHYLLGYKASSWSGAFIGLVEAGIGGFILGYVIAWLHNIGLGRYVSMIRRRAVREEEKEILEKV
ncbi:MAG: NAD(P)/FAD-dependent oxidoreductase [Phycisphaerae bacterium]|nr:NAD(P)/FAD-dependent oxidoreductase [Phycisphaerae bacterium]